MNMLLIMINSYKNTYLMYTFSDMDRQLLRVSDSFMENFFCIKCLKYLTVGPIGIHKEGGNVCGRCLYGRKQKKPPFLELDGDPFDYENRIPLSLFAYASCTNIRFPCVNRYDGCNELIPFVDIGDHEESCVSEKYQCPNCDFLGVGSQQIHHFSINHKNLLISNEPFELNIGADISSSYLCRQNNYLFFVNVQYVKSLNQFVFGTTFRGHGKKLGKILLSVFIPNAKKFEKICLNTDLLEIQKQRVINFTINIGTYHLNDVDKIYCIYKVSIE